MAKSIGGNTQMYPFNEAYSAARPGDKAICIATFLGLD